MGSFRYTAVNEVGTVIRGTLVADGPRDVRAQLRQMKLFPERVEPVSASALRLRDRLPGAKLRNAAHVAIFTRQCCVLLASGVPVVEALQVLARQTEHPGLSLALQEIREAVNAGRSLAEALAGYPQFFDRSFVGMVASGEKSGAMDVVFARLADFLERRRHLQARISSALFYPCLLVVMAIGLLVFLSAYVIPTIEPLLEQHHRPLPLSTMLLFGMGDALRSYGGIALVVLLAALLLGAWMRRSERYRAAMDRLILRIPLFGKIWLKSLVARFTMAFGTLLRTGVPAVEALEVLEGLAPNTAFIEEIRRIRADVVEGKDISSRMRDSRFFPPMVGYMVAVGERSGSLAEVLEHVSNAYESEVEIASRRLLAVLEPALVLVMAAVVGFIAMSLMVTILELSHF